MCFHPLIDFAAQPLLGGSTNSCITDCGGLLDCFIIFSFFLSFCCWHCFSVLCFFNVSKTEVHVFIYVFYNFFKDMK